jgi:hypothetical protein
MDRVSTLLDAARRAVSLDDFGEESFREGLEILVRSADAHARFTERGRRAFDAQIVSFLSRRLEIEHWYARHPEIDEQEIIAPLIGLGLPRTGSTALSCMLAEDRAARSLRYWEAASPCPPPEAATQDSDPRVAAAEQALARRHQLIPGLKAMLPLSATGPMECQNFMGYDFKSNLFAATLEVPEYCAWLYHEADLVPTYRYVKRVLKLLQWRCPPNRWRLKNPAHMMFVTALDQVFPDARFWMTHRDIAQVIPSITDMLFALSSGGSDSVDREYLSRFTQESWELGLRRLIVFRDAGAEDRFFDVQFETFQRDPFPVIQSLYDFLGEPLTPEARGRMEAWRLSTPRDKHGGHDYSAADYGLDPEALRQRFAFYAKRFGAAAASPA